MSTAERMALLSQLERRGKGGIRDRVDTRNKQQQAEMIANMLNKQQIQANQINMDSAVRKNRQSDLLFEKEFATSRARLDEQKSKNSTRKGLEGMDYIIDAMGASIDPSEVESRLAEIGQDKLIPAYKAILGGDQNALKQFEFAYKGLEQKAYDLGIRDKPEAQNLTDFEREVELEMGKDWARSTPQERQTAYRAIQARKASKGSQGKTDLELTPAQKKVDEKFAEDYLAFNARGGMGDVEKNLAQLKSVEAQLAGIVGFRDNPEGYAKFKDLDLTGDVKGIVPDKVLELFNEEAIAAKEEVQEVAQRNLRLVLGGQFSEREGEQLINRAYNDALDEGENLKRVRRLIDQISKAAESKLSASRYYDQHGTLKGWKGSMPTMRDIEQGAGLDSDLTYNPETGEFE